MIPGAFTSTALADNQPLIVPTLQQQLDLSALTIEEQQADGKTVVVLAANSANVMIDITEKTPPPIEADNEEVDQHHIPDPLYYFNLINFHFNDKLYFWVLEPVASGYKYVAPEVVRLGISNFFGNLRSSINIVNNLWQLKLDRFGTELFRLVFNSTAGLGGIMDASCDWLDICKRPADFAQTLGHYGVGQGIYLVWPILGPSSSRDTSGFVVDQFMSPPTYIGCFLIPEFYQSAGAMMTERINDTSFRLGDYEALIGCAVDDKYVTVRNAYVQYMDRRVKKSFE
jgi:phospholipid-binding lipoprotein MlaA